jgi:hypothetical protein
VDEIPQEALYAKEVELFEELLQEGSENPIFQAAVEDGEPGKDDPIVTAAGGGIVDNGDDSMFHNHLGDGFEPDSAYPHSPTPADRIDPLGNHKIVGYDNYKNDVLRDAKIMKPVFARKKGAPPVDPVIGGLPFNNYGRSSDVPVVDEHVGDYNNDFSAHEIKKWAMMDKVAAPAAAASPKAAPAQGSSPPAAAASPQAAPAQAAAAPVAAAPAATGGKGKGGKGKGGKGKGSPASPAKPVAAAPAPQSKTAAKAAAKKDGGSAAAEAPEAAAVLAKKDASKKAPAKKAPATKAPATKAPAKKAPANAPALPTEDVVKKVSARDHALP